MYTPSASCLFATIARETPAIGETYLFGTGPGAYGPEKPAEIVRVIGKTLRGWLCIVHFTGEYGNCIRTVESEK